MYLTWQYKKLTEVIISRKALFLNLLYLRGKVIFLHYIYSLFKLYIQAGLSLISCHIFVSVFPVYHITAKGFMSSEEASIQNLFSLVLCQ